MKYIVVTSQNGRSYYLAKQKIGGAGAYVTIATFLSEETAKKTAEILNLNRTQIAARLEEGKGQPAFHPI